MSTFTQGRYYILFNRGAGDVSTTTAGNYWQTWLSKGDSYTRFGWGTYYDVYGTGATPILRGRINTPPTFDCADQAGSLQLEVHNPTAADVICNISFGVDLGINGVEGFPIYFWDDTIGVFESNDGFWIKGSEAFSSFCSSSDGNGCTTARTILDADEPADSGPDAVHRYQLGGAWKNIVVSAGNTVIRGLTFMIANPNPSESPMASPCPNPYFTGGVMPSGTGAFRARPYPFADSAGVFVRNNNPVLGRFRLSATADIGIAFASGRAGLLAQGLTVQLILEPTDDCKASLPFLVNISSTEALDYEVDVAFGALLADGIGGWTVRGVQNSGFRFTGSGRDGETWVLVASDVLSNVAWGNGTTFPENSAIWWSPPAAETAIGSNPGWFTFAWTHIVVPAGGVAFRRFVLTFNDSIPSPTASEQAYRKLRWIVRVMVFLVMF